MLNLNMDVASKVIKKAGLNFLFTVLQDLIAPLPPIIWIYSIYYHTPWYIRIINALMAIYSIRILLRDPFYWRFLLLSYPQLENIVSLLWVILVFTCIVIISIYEIYFAIRKHAILTQYQHTLLRIVSSILYGVTYLSGLLEGRHGTILGLLLPLILWIYGRICQLHPALRILGALFGSIPVIVTSYVMTAGTDIPASWYILMLVSICCVVILLLNEIYHAATGTSILPYTIANIILYIIGISMYIVLLYVTGAALFAHAFAAFDHIAFILQTGGTVGV